MIQWNWVFVLANKMCILVLNAFKLLGYVDSTGFWMIVYVDSNGFFNTCKLCICWFQWIL